MNNNYIQYIDESNFDKYIRGNNSLHSERGGVCQSWLYLLGKSIFVLGIKIAIRLIENNNKTNNQLIEIQAKGDVDCKKIEKQGDVKCKIIETQGEVDCKKIEKRGEVRCKVLDKEFALKKAFHDYKHARKENEKQKQQQQTSSGLEEWLQQYHQAHPERISNQLKMRNLIFPWMTEGYDIGLLAPTDCGKTTFVLQVAMALSKGTCDNPISPQCDAIEPTRTLVFSLEQSEMEINTYYGDVINKERLLTIRSGEWFGENPTVQILEEIQKEMMVAKSGEGIVVIIDNFTKLLDISSHAQVEQFCKSLDRMRHASIEAGNPLTILKVFHTNKKCRVDRRFTIDSFRGDSKLLYATQNVLYLTYCNQGSDKRILGFIKWKNGDKHQLWMLQYANTQPYQYHYVGLAKEKDMGMPSNEEKPKKETRGRNEKISLEACIDYYNQHKKGKRLTCEIAKEAGVTWNTIYKRLKREGYLTSFNHNGSKEGNPKNRLIRRTNKTTRTNSEVQ